MKWCSIIPLIGGGPIGVSFECGKPEFILSYKEFFKNDISLLKYWNYEKKYFDIENDQYPDSINIDFVFGVPPCAGLAQLNCGGSVNESKKRGAEAEQNQYMYKTAEFVLSKIKPKVYFGENARELFTATGEKVAANLFEIAKKYNYSFSLYKTDSNLHKLPQHRVRTFFFFWNTKKSPILNWYNEKSLELTEYLNFFKKEIHHNIEKSTKDLLQNDFYNFIIFKLGRNYRQILLNDKYKFHGKNTILSYIISENLYEEFYNFTQNSKLKEKIYYIKEKLNNKKEIWDFSPAIPNKNVNAIISKNMFYIHPNEERFLTIREYMSLMGLPEDFNLVNEKNYLQITQNVPTNTSRDMTKEVVKFIKGELKFSSGNFIKQDNVINKIEIKNKVENTNKFFK